MIFLAQDFGCGRLPQPICCLGRFSIVRSPLPPSSGNPCEKYRELAAGIVGMPEDVEKAFE